MFTPEEVQRLRQQSGDSAVFNQLLSDPEFKAKVDRVQQANPNMTEFEKIKFPSAMIDIHLGKKQKSSPIQQQTAQMVSNGNQQQSKGAWDTLTQDPLIFAGQTAKNILPSTGRLIGGVASMVTSPIETGKTLFKLGVGGTANTLESIASLAGVRNPEEIFDLESEEVASAVGDFYVQRYGSLDAAATTLRDDPAGFLSDLGGVVTGVGGLVKGGATALGAATGAATRTSTALTGLGRGIRAAQSVGGSLVKTGVNMEPLVIMGKGVVMAGRGAKNVTRAATIGMIPDNMVTKSLKVNPSDISAFSNLPGNESMGSFLMRKGVLSGGAAEVGDAGIKLTGSLPVGRTRIGIIDDLGKIFDKALKTVDNELAGVRQTYDILDDVPADIPKLLDQIYTVAQKYDLKEQVQFIEGLLKKERVSLAELNQLKRTAYDLFQTYKTSNVPADSFAARQINQYERVLRKFIEDQAEIKGLPDIGALNDDIMKTREILDAIEKADASSLSKGKLTFGLYDGMFGIGAYGLTGDFMTTAGIVMGRKLLDSTIFKTTFAKYLNRLDPRNIEILDKAFRSMKHTKESKTLLRKVVAQTADDIKNNRIGEEEASRAIPDQFPAQQGPTSTPMQQAVDSSPSTLPDTNNGVNTSIITPDIKPNELKLMIDDFAQFKNQVKESTPDYNIGKKLGAEIGRLNQKGAFKYRKGGIDGLDPQDIGANIKDAIKYHEGKPMEAELRKFYDTLSSGFYDDITDSRRFTEGFIDAAHPTKSKSRVDMLQEMIDEQYQGLSKDTIIDNQGHTAQDMINEWRAKTAAATEQRNATRASNKARAVNETGNGGGSKNDTGGGLTPEEISNLTPEEKATGLIGGSDSVPFEKQMAKMDRQDIKRWMNAEGEALLSKMENAGKKTKDVTNRFWDDTYENLSEAAKANFDSYIKAEYGGITVEGKSMSAKDLFNKYNDMGSTLDNIDGTERGLITLMDEANTRFSGDSSLKSFPKSLKP